MPVDSVTRLFKTLGDPTRLRLVHLLGAGELSVMELAEITDCSQSRISNQLKILRKEGLVRERRDGAWRYYRVERDSMPDAARDVWGAMESAWSIDSTFQADRARRDEVVGRRHERNGRFFDAIAAEWDSLRETLFGDGIGREMLRAFVPRDLTLADIGAGTGYAIDLFGNRPRRIFAIDNSEAMLAVARRKVEAHGLTNVEFRLGDAHEPPLAPGEADVVSFAMTLHHLEEPERALKAAARKLGPRGRLFVADLARHEEIWLRDVMNHRHLGFARTDLEAWLGDVGMEVVSWAALPGRAWTTPGGERVQLPDGFAFWAGRTDRKGARP